MARSTFDGEAFFSALDAERQARKTNWKKIAAEAGISASTLTRMAQGKRPDVNTLAALCSWAGLDADDFMRSDDPDIVKPRPEPLTAISAWLRSDPNLTPEGAIALDELVKASYARLRKDARE